MVIFIRVRLDRAYFKFPGQTGNTERETTFPVAPPSTVFGFLESLAGQTQGGLTGISVSYGMTRAPAGRGHLTSTSHVIANTNINGEKHAIWSTRMVSQVVDFDAEYVIAVRGDDASLGRIRDAIRGDIPRQGVLSFGPSDNRIVSLKIVDEIPPTDYWVTPTDAGLGFPLSLRVVMGTNIDTVFRSYRFSRVDPTNLPFISREVT